MRLRQWTPAALLAAMGFLAIACSDARTDSSAELAGPQFGKGGNRGPPAGDPSITVEFADRAGDNVRSDNHAIFGRVYDDGVCNVDATFNLGDARLFLKGKINKKDRATCGDPRRIQVAFTDRVGGSQPGGRDGSTVEATFFKVNDVELVTVAGTVLRTAVIGGAGCPHQLLFNPGQDPLSDSVEVSQNADGTWTVATQPYANNVAVCIPNEDKANPPPRSYYHMPFEITVTLK